MKFRDCNQATRSGAGKGTAAVTGAEGRGCGSRPSPHLNFHAKGNELPPIASRKRPRRATIETSN